MNSKQEKDLRRRVNELLASQTLAVLATHNTGEPYANLIAFAPFADLSHLLFATTRSTRKFHNLQADPRVALLIDNRTNKETDFHEAAAVTALGRAIEVTESERQELEGIYLARHPYLADFLKAPSTALFKVTINCFIMVSRFQKVMELRMNDETYLSS